jgi:hypothetical protein
MSNGYAGYIKQEGGGNFEIAVAASGTAGSTLSSMKYVKISNSTGAVSASNFCISSARELKTDIREISNLERFDNIKIIQFKFTNDETGKIRYGVIAEDIENITPELVYGNKENKTVGYIDLLLAKMSRLEQRINELENN